MSMEFMESFITSESGTAVTVVFFYLMLMAYIERVQLKESVKGHKIASRIATFFTAVWFALIILGFTNAVNEVPHNTEVVKEWASSEYELELTDEQALQLYSGGIEQATNECITRDFEKLTYGTVDVDGTSYSLECQKGAFSLVDNDAEK